MGISHSIILIPICCRFDICQICRFVGRNWKFMYFSYHFLKFYIIIVFGPIICINHKLQHLSLNVIGTKIIDDTIEKCAKFVEINSSYQTHLVCLFVLFLANVLPLYFVNSMVSIMEVQLYRHRVKKIAGRFGRKKGYKKIK